MIREWTEYIIRTAGLNDAGVVYDLTAIAVIAVVSFVTGALVRRFVFPLIVKAAHKTKTQWDDHLFGEKVLNAAGKLIPAVMINVLANMVFAEEGNQSVLAAWHYAGFKLLNVYIIAVSTKLICAVADASDTMFSEYGEEREHSMHGVFQMVKLVAVCGGVIVSVGVMLDESPLTLIAGLGAAATVLMLVFRDVIVGFAAGIQLSVNNMLRPGDWITVPKCGADGVVFEVSMTTVKVRNWDNTITTVPPYLLVSDSFQNWRGMSESDGRRMKRSIRIDMHSVVFCSAQQMSDLAAKGFADAVPAGTGTGKVTNVVVYAGYMERFLKNHPEVNADLNIMVRQLEPGSEGLPLEIYCFCKDKSWNNYEHFQAEILAHAIAVLPEFGLKIFQRSASSSASV